MRLTWLRLLAVCLPFAAATACGSRDDTRRADVRIDAAAEPRDRGAAANQLPSYGNGARIVVLGDSLTAGLGLATEEAYPAVLQGYLDAKGLRYQVVNAGISGDTSAGGLSRLDWALEGDVRILIVALGGNDALRGLPVTQLRDNLTRIIERAQSRGVTVILAGMEA